MKYYYRLKINKNSFLSICRKFKSRNAALNYVFKKLSSNSELDYEKVISKHNIEYVCTDHNRFSIERCAA